MTRPRQAPGCRPPAARWWVVLAVVASLSLAGCARGTTVGASAPTTSAWPSSGAEATERPAAPCPDPGPTKVVGGAPAGFCPDAAGARAAGVAFVRLNERLVALDPDAAGTAWRAMATEASAEALATDVVARLARLHERWPPGALTYRVAPLAVRAIEVGEGFDVDVWYVGVVAGAGIATYEEWVTDSFRLVWERDDWRVASFSDAPGPRPAPGHQPADDAAGLEARLVGFEPVA